MKQFLLCIALLLTVTSLCSAQGEIAVTIDDMPLLFHGQYLKDTNTRYSKFILDALDDYSIKATGFVTGRRLKKDYQMEFLSDFVNRGHSIGNHTFNHLDLNDVTVSKYEDDILECEKLITKWVKGKKYFRYPYLHRGDTIEKRQAIYKFLNDNSYTIVPVTIFNEDWKFDEQFEKAMKSGNSDGTFKITDNYIRYVKERTRHYQAIAKNKLGRDVKHIILFHMNLINAVCFKDIFTYFKERGWKFITVDEALTDSLYTMKEKSVSKESLSWLDRI